MSKKFYLSYEIDFYILTSVVSVEIILSIFLILGVHVDFPIQWSSF